MSTSTEMKGDILPDGTERSENGAPPSLFSYTPLTAGLIGGTAAAVGEVNDDGEAGPALGADMAAIRARVLGRRRPSDETAADPTPDELREIYDELKSRYQVDLNLEINAAALEDPALIAHMEAARRRLAEHEKALLRLPHRETLRTTYILTVQKLSALINKLSEKNQAERENVEIGYRHARVLGELAAGRQPYGFPAFGPASVADPGTQEAMKIASETAARIAESYEGLLALAEDANKTIFVLRREIEVFGDGLLALVEASEEDRRRLREFLRIAAPAKAAKAAADPGHTLGERPLAPTADPGHTLGERPLAPAANPGHTLGERPLASTAPPGESGIEDRGLGE